MDEASNVRQPTQLNRFTSAVRTAGLTSFAALVLGMGFVFSAKYYGLLEREHLGILHYLLGIFLEHVGIGLVVSSIAVFAYEWLVHTEENIILTNSLNEAVLTISKDTEALKQMKLAFGKEAFEKGIGELFGTKADGRRYHFEKNIVQIVNDAYELKQIQTEESVQYLNALSWLLWHTVRDNTTELVNFAKGSKRDWVYSVPESAAQMASRILGAQMKTMRDGDFYFSVSQVDLYEHKQLSYFFKQTEDALKRGITIQRIFNLCLIDETIPLHNENQNNAGEIVSEDLQEIMEILEAHTALMDRTNNNKIYKGTYDVKFFITKNVKNVLKETSQSRDEIKKATFGLFDRKDADKLICFEAIKTNPPLSQLRLHYSNKDSQEKALFDSMWKHSVSENPFINEAVGPANP